MYHFCIRDLRYLHILDTKIFAFYIHSQKYLKSSIFKLVQKFSESSLHFFLDFLIK